MFHLEFVNIPPNQVQDMGIRRPPLVFCNVMQFVVKDTIVMADAYMFHTFFHKNRSKQNLTPFCPWEFILSTKRVNME